ncbi:hypothetical protein PMAYCL1PPCAC_10138, partial [Pristionchus mayeri]
VQSYTRLCIDCIACFNSLFISQLDMEQRFTLPGLPLHRELQAPVTIGTQFSVRATPIEHDKNTVTFTLVTDKSEAALEITLHLPDKHGRSAKLRAISRSATSESSPLEKEVSTLAVNKELILGVIVKEHVFEIYLDTVFLLPFVHRMNPSEIKKIVLDGAMICNEVVVVPVKTDMPPLPQYNEVSLNTRLLQPTLPPQPAPRGSPAGAVAVLPPYPAGTLQPPVAAAVQRPEVVAASIIGKPPQPDWTAPVSPPPMQMPQPHPAQQIPTMHQQLAPPPLPPRISSGAPPVVPTTSAGSPAAPPVAPMQYGVAPLPPQAYPHSGGTGPQFQNIQQVPGISYATGQQQHQQHTQSTQQQQPYTQYPGYYTGASYGAQYYPNFPVSGYAPGVQYQYPAQYSVQCHAYPSVYMNSHCNSDYNYWHHHHHC